MKKRLSIEEITKRLLDMDTGIELLSTEYKNAHTPLLFRCLKCNHEFMKTWSNVQSLKQYCVKCGVEKRWENRKRHNIDDIRKILKERYKHIKLISGHSESARTKVRMYCTKCNIEFEQHYNALQNGKGCKYCGIKQRSGERHHGYNPNLTNEERVKSRDMLYGENKTLWRSKVHRKHRWMCVICGSKEDIVAHHLDSYANHPDKRTDVNNGVTLCDKHHKDFHRVFGYKNNTKVQFKEYMNNKLKATH